MLLNSPFLFLATVNDIAKRAYMNTSIYRRWKCATSAKIIFVYAITDARSVTHRCTASGRRDTAAAASTDACPSPPASSRCSPAPWRTRSRTRRCAHAIFRVWFRVYNKRGMHKTITKHRVRPGWKEQQHTHNDHVGCTNYTHLEAHARTHARTQTANSNQLGDAKSAHIERNTHSSSMII